MADYHGMLTGQQIDALPGLITTETQRATAAEQANAAAIAAEASARGAGDAAVAAALSVTDGKVGNLADLQTTAKTSLVAAVNEIVGGQVEETVTVGLVAASGSIAYEGKNVEVTIDGVKTDYAVNSEGYVVFKVAMGKTYTIHYPVYHGYAAPEDESHEAVIAMRYLTKTYDTLDSVAASVVLEESSNPLWTKGGKVGEIDAILGSDGSWVIDEVHKKRAKLSATNDLMFADGTTWSGTYGNAFRHIVPSYFTHTTNGNGKSVLHCSRRRISEKKFHDMWIGKFKGNVHDGKLWSQPSVAATGSITIDAFFNNAKAQGSDYGIISYFDQKYLVALHLLKFGTPAVEISADVPGNMGGGLQSAGGAYYNFNTGATTSLGDGTGEVALTDGSANKQNKLFGIEALTGQQWEFVQNIYANNAKFHIYKGNQLSNSISEGHADYLRNCVQLSGSGSYIKKMVLGEHFDIVPTELGSSSSQDWTDAFWGDPTGLRVVLFGGYSNGGSNCGLGYSGSDDGWSNADSSYGSRLAFRGSIDEYEVVTGAELAALNN